MGTRSGNRPLFCSLNGAGLFHKKLLIYLKRIWILRGFWKNSDVQVLHAHQKTQALNGV